MNPDQKAKIDSPDTLPEWPFPWPSFTVDWSKAALLVIDYQNYGCNPEVGLAKLLLERHPEVAAYYVPRITEVTIPNARRLLDAFRAAGREVIFTRHGALLEDGRDLILRRRRRDQDSLSETGRPNLWAKGSYEHEIVAALKPLPHELVIDKNSSSAFNSTGIDQLLRNLGIETLCLVGMATAQCVECTGRDAADRGYNVIAVEDAIATFFPQHHAASLSALARVYGQVWDTDRVLSALAAATTAEPSSKAERP